MIKRIFEKISDDYQRYREFKRYEKIYTLVRDYTMIDAALFADNLQLIKRLETLAGDVVECGVWRGGMSAGLAFASSRKRHFYLFDSFEGLPQPSPEDGQRALHYIKGAEPEIYYDNCRAEMSYAETIMKATGQPHTLVKGWFNDTLPNYVFSNALAVLRLDGDWYDSTMICLKLLFPRLVKGGLVIIDDYHSWDGCTKAVHDYLSQIRSVSRINRTPNGVAYIIKRDEWVTSFPSEVIA